MKTSSCANTCAVHFLVQKRYFNCDKFASLFAHIGAEISITRVVAAPVSARPIFASVRLPCVWLSARRELEQTKAAAAQALADAEAAVGRAACRAEDVSFFGVSHHLPGGGGGGRGDNLSRLLLGISYPPKKSSRRRRQSSTTRVVSHVQHG